jgi:hypothetical protein
LTGLAYYVLISDTNRLLLPFIFINPMANKRKVLREGFQKSPGKGIEPRASATAERKAKKFKFTNTPFQLP